MEKENKKEITEPEKEIIKGINSLGEVLNDISEKLDRVDRPVVHTSDTKLNTSKIGDIHLSSPHLSIPQLNQEAIKLLKDKDVNRYLTEKKVDNKLNARPMFQ